MLVDTVADAAVVLLGSVVEVAFVTPGVVLLGPPAAETPELQPTSTATPSPMMAATSTMLVNGVWRPTR